MDPNDNYYEPKLEKPSLDLVRENRFEDGDVFHQTKVIRETADQTKIVIFSRKTEEKSTITVKKIPKVEVKDLFEDP